MLKNCTIPFQLKKKLSKGKKKVVPWHDISEIFK